ncbi:hypothetical protein H310_14343 [Aphanomyces invadans]|uniref:Uncharacterized protein n=1 Tax=Aphanomyces invadans TaxID=157072 RepID=A0A024TBP2_9STRA|nr:hypothetical protein H310_14343 [Aphanomyces invadans]ETV91021.1 hypothetical protein H310_14343 [Aphanomyces invadans]|eukprot:XP_008880410.1 hypothetical protein H310_14343 [Aphanomyces invadans]
MATRHGATNAYDVDMYERHVLLSCAGQQVMMAWERDYMEACVDALGITPATDVLEIGFGLAYSATRIQSYNPKSHTIIECDPVSFAALQAWSKSRANVVAVPGSWQSMLPSLGAFDCVFFDDYPLPPIERDESMYSLSRWHDFLDLALNWHVHVGGRVTGYLARPIDLRRDGCDVVMTPFQVDVPDNCTYFPYHAALVPLVTLLERKPSITTYALCRPCDADESPAVEHKVVTSHPKLIELRRRLDLQKYHESEVLAEASAPRPQDPRARDVPRDDFIRQLKAMKAKKLAATPLHVADVEMVSSDGSVTT